MLDLSLSSILASLLFSGIGFWLLGEARRRGDFRFMFIALGLMLYSYFTKGPWLDWGVGFALCAAAWKIW